jgi:hypothetical protein
MNARRTTAGDVATVPAATSTITLRRRGVLAVAGTAVIAAASLGATATAYAKKGDDNRKDVRKSVACGTGHLKLKAKTESGNRLELEAEVDSNKAGQEWTVVLTNDGKTVWTGKRMTAGPSGSFSVETTIDADATEATPTESPTSSTTTDAPTDTATTTDAPTDTATTTDAPTDTASATTTTSTATASPTTSDDSGHDKGDDHPSVRAAGSKGADEKGGDDKGGDDKKGDDKKGDDKKSDDKGKPATGKHVIGVTATYGTLTCAADLTI